MSQSKMLVAGSEIVYSIVAISQESYEHAIQDVDPSIYGFVVNGIYRPADDLTLKCKKDWSLSIVENYRQCPHWVVIKEHPGDLYAPMTSILQEITYHALTYDVWQSEAGLVAVVTESDV